MKPKAMKSKNKKLSRALGSAASALDAAMAAVGEGPPFDELQHVNAIVCEVLDHTNGRVMEGRCQYCGCTEQTPCELEGGACAWHDKKYTVCTNPDCIAKSKAGAK